MKIKWTTITEDKSTWPPTYKNIIVYNGKKSSQACWWTMCHNEMTMYLFGNKFIEFPKEAIGFQWRPMPKPPKKKELRSPWKPKTDKPKHKNEVLVRHKLSTGEWLYGIGCIFRNEWSWDKVGHIDEWMEIPE